MVIYFHSSYRVCVATLYILLDDRPHAHILACREIGTIDINFVSDEIDVYRMRSRIGYWSTTVRSDRVGYFLDRRSGENLSSSRADSSCRLSRNAGVETRSGTTCTLSLSETIDFFVVRYIQICRARFGALISVNSCRDCLRNARSGVFFLIRTNRGHGPSCRKVVRN